MHLVRDESDDDDREQDDGPDDSRFDEFGFEPNSPAYANGKRKQRKRPAKLEGLSPPPKDISEITSQMRDAFSRLNAFAKVELGDLDSLDALPPKAAHDAQLAWTNLLVRSEIRSKRSTGVVRISVEALTKPFRIGRRAVEAGLATLIELNLVRVFHESRRKARTYVLVPVYIRFRETSSPSHGVSSSDQRAAPSPSHGDGLSPSHGGSFSAPSPSHGGSFSAPTTPTQASESSSPPPSGSSTPADHAAAAPTSPAGAAGASRPAAAAARAATDRNVWDSVLGADHYTWTETEHSITIGTKLFFKDEQGSDRAVSLRWNIDKHAGTALISFPKSKGYPDIGFPWDKILAKSNATWEEFAGEGHGYTTFDFLICVERLTYVFAAKHNEIDSPVGFLDLVRWP
jgi:hypothetical protein